MNFEDQLREAAAEANRIIMSNLPEPSECVHEFSPKFERQMARMTKRAETPARYYLQKVACTALVLGIVLGAGVVASTDAGARFRGWVKEQYETWIHYVFEGDSSKTPVERKDYRLSWLPEGFWEADVYEQPTGTTVIYKNADDISIRFRYGEDIENGELFINEENMRVSKTNINKVNAQIYWPTNGQLAPFIVWTNSENNIVFIITGDVTDNDLIKMAESVE